MTLSGQAQTVLESLQKLPVAEREEIHRLEGTALASEISQAAPSAAAQRRAAANSVIRQGVAIRLILKAGGIFLGEKELKELGVIREGVTVPPVPNYFSRAFLNADHPVRGGKIAAHIILGFDPSTNHWCCFEKSIVPGSLGADGKGLSGSQQDELLLDGQGAPRIVLGMAYTSPVDYRPLKRVLDNVISLQHRAGVKVRDLPFYDVYGRTADTRNASPNCRVLLGDSCNFGSRDHVNCFVHHARSDIGLLAGWNLKSDR
jgi:hypothetical protein